MALSFFLLVLLALPAMARDLEAGRGDLPPEGLIFESRPAGELGGAAQGLGNVFFPGHSFRVLERTQVTRVSATLSAFTQGSVFAALHRIEMPLAAADVVGDSTLLATTLLEVPGGNVAQDVEAPMTAVLEPGWYAIVLGVGRYGATAGTFQVSLPDVVAATTPQSYGQYSLNSETGQMTLVAIRARYSVFGHALPPLPAPEDEFRSDTAQPYAFMYSTSGTDYQGYSAASDRFIATRFSIDQGVKLRRAGFWAFSGNGSLFAAVLRMNSPTGVPPQPNSTAFLQAVVASTTVNVGHAANAYYGSFNDEELEPGHYVLVVGSGLFGTSGEAPLLRLGDSMVQPGAMIWIPPQWFPEGAFGFDNFWIQLTAFVPEQASVALAADLDPAGTGEPVTFTATVSGEHDAPTDGQVQIMASTGETCTAPASFGGAGQSAEFHCQISFASVGPRTLTARFGGSTTHFSAESMMLPFLVARIADLSVEIDDAMLVSEPGAAAEYLVQVRNSGPDPAPGTAIVVTADPALAGASWTCAPVGGASCPQAQGNGEIGHIANLPAGGGLDYLFTGQFVLDMPPTLIAAAQVSADIASPNFVLDRQPGDNQATDVNLSSAIFRDGFEP